jgi:hypothetical protein
MIGLGDLFHINSLPFTTYTQVLFLLCIKADLENVVSISLPPEAQYCLTVSAACCRLRSSVLAPARITNPLPFFIFQRR